MYSLTHFEVADLVREMADDISINWHSDRAVLAVYPVPRGGVPVAYMLQHLMSVEIVDKPEHADVIVDDLVDSGATRERMRFMTKREDGENCFYALIDKTKLSADHPHNDWIEFPWEQSEAAPATDAVVRLLQFIGEDVDREGLLETPSRVIRAWQEWTQGYGMNPADILKTFKDGTTDEMVIERRIPFFSHCEHHMAPFFGTVDIGYIPNGKIVGLSKMNRLVECFSRRLQVQERMGQQIADAMMEHLDPLGVGVIVTGKHMCAMSRGVRHSGCDMVTSALRGCFMEGTPRAEFLALTR